MMHLNVNVKYTPSQAAICFIISEHYLSKMEIYCVVSISQAKCIISQRKGRNTCIHVEFSIVHCELICTRPCIVGWAITIKEVASVNECPVCSLKEKPCLSGHTSIIIICLISIRNYLLSTTIYIERVPSWDKQK